MAEETTIAHKLKSYRYLPRFLNTLAYFQNLRSNL